MNPLTRDRAIYDLIAAGWSPVDLAAVFDLAVPEVKRANKRHWAVLGRPEKIDSKKLVAAEGRIRPTQVAALDDYLHAAKEIGVTVALPPVTVQPGEDVFAAMIRCGVAPSHGEGPATGGTGVASIDASDDLPRGTQLPGAVDGDGKPLPPVLMKGDPGSENLGKPIDGLPPGREITPIPAGTDLRPRKGKLVEALDEAAAHARGEIPLRTTRWDKDGNRITGLEYVDGRPEEGETGLRPGGAYRDAGKTEGGL